MDETLLEKLDAIGDDYHEQHTLAVQAGNVETANAYLHKLITVSRIMRLVMGVE